MLDRLCGNCKLCDFSSGVAEAKNLEVRGNAIVRAMTQLTDNSFLQIGDMSKRLKTLQESLDDSMNTVLDALHPRGVKQCSGMEGVVTRSDTKCTNPMYFSPKSK